jgi:post-segregation antitoxin (ccd killing protein)
MSEVTESTNEQEVRECAYALWEEAGSPEGQEMEFWQRARELIAKRNGHADVDGASEDSFPASDPVNHM